MSLAAVVENGKIVESASQSSLASASSTSSSGMDKDSFLQLLVAQMKYQDPLEPTSNTEFVSQYAQFSQVEQMQNMAGSIELQRASSLVGQTVYVESTSSSGNTTTISGKVDYVTYESGKAYLVINESLYSIDSLLHVVDKEYLEAVELATELVVALNKLPNVNGIDLSDAESIDKLEESYNNMSKYQKTFVADDKVKELEKYIEKLKEVRTAAEESEARSLASKLATELDALSGVDDLTLDEESTIGKLEEIYNNMTDYQKTFVNSDYVKLLEAYTEKLKELKAAKDSDDSAEGE